LKAYGTFPLAELHRATPLRCGSRRSRAADRLSPSAHAPRPAAKPVHQPPGPPPTCCRASRRPSKTAVLASGRRLSASRPLRRWRCPGTQPDGIRLGPGRDAEDAAAAVLGWRTGLDQSTQDAAAGSHLPSVPRQRSGSARWPACSCRRSKRVHGPALCRELRIAALRCVLALRLHAAAHGNVRNAWHTSRRCRCPSTRPRQTVRLRVVAASPASAGPHFFPVTKPYNGLARADAADGEVMDLPFCLRFARSARKRNKTPSVG